MFKSGDSWFAESSQFVEGAANQRCCIDQVATDALPKNLLPLYETDYFGTPRPQAGKHDIGFYEYAP